MDKHRSYEHNYIITGGNVYQFISSIAKALNGDKQWATIDINNIPLNTLFATYSRIIVTLSNPFIVGNIAVDLVTIRSTVDGLSITFNDFLILNGNKTLVTLPNMPTLTPRYAKYADSFHAGYKVAPITPRAAVDSQVPLADKSWLHLTKTNVDYNLFYKNCLVNVNGFFHLTDSDSTGIYVVDGMKSLRLSNHNQLGMYSFRELGEITLVPITPSMIHKQNDRQLYKDCAYVNLGIDVSNKTVMLVLGGYLHVLDNNTFTQVSNSAFEIDIANLPLLDRYFESKKYIDLSSLPLSSTSRNINQISIAEFFSDANIVAYLTLSQSFFVILDNPDIFVERTPIRKTKLSDMFISYEKPLFPLVVGAGKLTNYWATPEDGQYSITCLDTVRENYVYDTIDPTKVNSVSNAQIPEHPVRHGNAYFLKIGCDTIP